MPPDIKAACFNFINFLFSIIITFTREADIIFQTRASGAHATLQRLATTSPSSRTAPSSSSSFRTRASGPNSQGRGSQNHQLTLPPRDVTHSHRSMYILNLFLNDFCRYLFVGRGSASDSPSVNSTQIQPTQSSSSSQA